MSRKKSADEIGNTIGRHLDKGDGQPLELERVTVMRAGRNAHILVPDATPEEKPKPEALSESASL